MDIFSSCHATADGIDISIINGLNKPRRKLMRLLKSNGMHHNATISSPAQFQAVFRRISTVNSTDRKTASIMTTRWFSVYKLTIDASLVAVNNGNG